MGNYLRETEFLNRRQVDNVKRASAFARHELGLPLNTAVTIYWAVASGGGGGVWSEKQRLLFTRLRHWLQRRDSPWVAIWTVENGQLSQGVHTHLAFHVPGDIGVADVTAYLHQQVGNMPGVLEVKPTRPPGGFPVWQTYMLKGMNPELWDAYGVPKKWRKGEGLVTGKRCGVSRPIDAAARNRQLVSASAITSSSTPTTSATIPVSTAA